MLFSSLHEKLLARVRYRIQSGEITERGFAKTTGLSQPHLHNVLKGARSLSTASADLIFQHLGISVADLLDSRVCQPQTPSAIPVDAPHLGGFAGPLHKPDTENRKNTFYPVPPLTAISLQDPVWVTLGYDPEIFPYFQDNDIALIDRVAKPLDLASPDSVYLVETHDGMLVRALRTARDRLYLITPKTVAEPRLWTPLPRDGRDPGEVIFGRLILIQRELHPGAFDIAISKP